jgi:hypothetical protein
MKFRLSGSLLIAALFPFVASPLSLARQEQPASQNQMTDPGRAVPTDQSPSQIPTLPENPPTGDLTIPQLRVVTGAGPFPSGRVSPLQLGPIYLKSADFSESIDAISAANQPRTLVESDSLFRALIVFDHLFRTSRLTVQYQPRLSIINSRVQTDTSNLNADWTSNFQLSPRVSVGLDNGFNYYGQQGQFDNLSLLGDLTSGTLVQSHFLDGAGHFLSERVEAPIHYLLGPRSHISVIPFFEYYTASGSQSVNGSESPGAEANYSYALSATKSLGLGYSVRNTHFSNSLPTTLYQNFTVNYAQQLSPTWRYSLMVGGITASQNGQSSQTTASGDFNLIKMFRDSSLIFQYYRGQAGGLQITNGFADRFDGSYDKRLSQRTRMNIGAGYYREFLSSTNTSGTYVSTGLSYQLNEGWFLQTAYAFKHQQNGGTAYETGDLQYVSFGIRWQPQHQALSSY